MTDTSWVDSHCHLYLHPDDPSAVLERAAVRGVRWVMCPGVDIASSKQARALAAAFPETVRWSAGLHPHEANRWSTEADDLADLAAEAAAVGECGLDFYRNLAPRDAQIVAFRAQLELAATLDKPIIVHCRDAFADVHDLLEAAAFGERAVLHCWTGGARWTKRFAALGVTFSFAGPLTYPTAETLRLAAVHAPPERTMLETDTPYLTPEPHRADRNEPALLPLTGAALADVWGTDLAAVAASTAAVATRIFGAPQ